MIREGTAHRLCHGFRKGFPGAIETDKYAFDPEAAVQALAESSYGGPENLPEITIALQQRRLEGAASRSEWVAGQYRDILGVELTLEPTEGTTLTALRKDVSTHPQIAVLGWVVSGLPDPQNWLSVYWTCESSFAQRLGYCNEEFDALTEQGDTTIDPDERIDILRASGPTSCRRRARSVSLPTTLSSFSSIRQ